MALLALAGLTIAAYLAWARHAGVNPVCLASGCERVQSSRYAELAGIPVATIGIAGYAGILATLWIPGEWGWTLSALLSFVGFGFSAYLTYVELFRLNATCQWCLASAILMTLLAVLAAWRLMRPPDSPRSHQLGRP
jgi:uncharacterized membrane protein